MIDFLKDEYDGFINLKALLLILKNEIPNISVKLPIKSIVFFPLENRIEQ